MDTPDRLAENTLKYVGEILGHSVTPALQTAWTYAVQHILRDVVDAAKYGDIAAADRAEKWAAVVGGSIYEETRSAHRLSS